ncbi:MAG: nucleotidyltransferase family protein [Gemmatimonadota bacterium]
MAKAMGEAAKAKAQRQSEMAHLTGEEQKSVTHGEFWIPEGERQVYQRALRTLNRHGVKYVVSGLYALYEYTGIYRKTKDLDLFVEPAHVVEAARTLKEDGFTVYLEQSHWIAKALWEDNQIDLIFGMGNGLSFIDELWWKRSRPGILAATPVRIAPPEDLIWHRLYVSERHRSDMSDVQHMLLRRGHELDWEHMLMRIDVHWRLLLAQVHLFDFTYPGHRASVPHWVRDRLNRRARAEMDDVGDPEVCYGTMISRFSFTIDVHEWGFKDPRKEFVLQARRVPIVQEICGSDVWEHHPTQKSQDG